MEASQETTMTKVAIAEETADQIRNGEGPIELVDANGQTVGIVRRPPTEAEVERAKQRASHGGQRLPWAQVMARLRHEVGG
jgi:hypothetical protein